MRLRRRVLTLALFAVAAPAVAGGFAHSPPTGSDTSAYPVIPAANEIRQQNVDLDMIVSMSGRCSIFKVAGRDLACRAVRYFHDQEGRAFFTVAVDDPTDKGNIVSFSGERARREEGRLYELTIDRMVLNSKDRPKVDGLRVPRVELSTGRCTQLGDFATGQISSISCVATDSNDRRYELRFESDGSPIEVQRVTTETLASKGRRAKRRVLLECRRKAHVAKILRRDAAAYIIQCLEENDQKAAPEEEQ